MGRIVCVECKAVYHKIYNPEIKDGVCNICGNKLVLREDDSKKVVKQRYTVYRNMIEPILEYYGSRITKVDAAKDADVIYKEIISYLKN